MGTQPARWTYLRDVGGFNGNTIGIEWKTPFFFPLFGDWSSPILDSNVSGGSRLEAEKQDSAKYLLYG
jgi:hypothetical protein